MQAPDKDIQTERTQNSARGMVKHPSKVFKQNELEMSTKQLQVVKKPTGYDSESQSNAKKNDSNKVEKPVQFNSSLQNQL